MNETGIIPVETKVLIKVDEVEEKDGLVWKPDVTKDREQYAHDKGILIDEGGLAFADFKGRIPQLGERVIFDKYAGKIFPLPKKNGERGVDNYRLCQDNEILAILEAGNGTE